MSASLRTLHPFSPASICFFSSTDIDGLSRLDMSSLRRTVSASMADSNFAI